MGELREPPDGRRRLFGCPIAYEARDGKRQRVEYFSPRNHDNPALHFLNLLNGERHVLFVVTCHNDVVRVVGNRRGDRAASESVGGIKKTRADVACAPVAFDDRKHHASRIVGEPHRTVAKCLHRSNLLLRDEAVRQKADHPGFLGRGFEVEGFGRHGRNPHRVREKSGLLLWRTDDKAPVARDEPALRPDGERTEVIKVVEKQQIGSASGRNHTAVLKAITFGGIESRHPHGVNGMDARLNGHRQHAVDVPALKRVGEVPVVGAEAEAPRKVGNEVLDQGKTVSRERAFTDRDVHAK